MRADGMTKGYARIIGGIYFLMFLTSIISNRLLDGVVFPNNAAATAHQILTHETLFRLGIATDLVDTGVYVALVALFYNLFRPVNPWVSLVAAFFGLAGCVIQAGGNVFDHFSLVLLRGGPGGLPINAGELPVLALLFLKLDDQAVNVALAFFAVYCLLIGYLILMSTFLPRILGALMVLAGVGWLTFLYEPLGDFLSPYVQLLGIVAEASLMLWLLVMGVRVERWKEQAGAV